MAVEEVVFPLKAIDVQVPSQVEQGLSTPERPVGDPQHTAGTSATPTSPVDIAVGVPEKEIYHFYLQPSLDHTKIHLETQTE